jgi:uncharacterized protein YceK
MNGICCLAIAILLSGCDSLATHLEKPGSTAAQRGADQAYCQYKATLAASAGSDMDRFNVAEQCMLYEKGYQYVSGRED